MTLSDRELLTTGGLCPGCGQRVCNLCGCKGDNPCVRTPADGPYPCAWSGDPPPPCTFCYQAVAERLYHEATSNA